MKTRINIIILITRCLAAPRKVTQLLLLLLFPNFIWGQALLVNTGQIKVSNNTTLFVAGTTVQQNIALVDLEGNFTITGDFINNVESGNVFGQSSIGVMEFAGDSMQYIKGNADKYTNYIAFPNIRVAKNDKYVALDAGMGANAKNLELQKGKFKIDADQNTSDLDITTHNSFTKSRMANFIVNTVNYNRDEQLNANQKGVVEVDMVLAENPDRENKLFGFVSPYKSIYSDYFFANYMAIPDQNGLWGQNATSVKDPNTKIMAGRGYIGGQNVLPVNRYMLDPAWGSTQSLHNARFNNKITFNRYQMEVEGNPIANVISQPDKHIIEEINTEDVIIDLKKGWQFIGNPFTSMLDMESFLNDILGEDDWNVKRMEDESAGVSARYLVLAGGEGVLDNWTPDRFFLNATWLVGQYEGSTISRDANDRNLIAPMQMIAVHANHDVSITIPASKRTHRTKGNSYPVYNELLLEVANSSSFDRLVLVFRGGATANATDKYDVIKSIDSLASPGQIFTLAEDGFAMITNILPESQKSVEMGMIPALSTQSYTLTAHRIASLATVNQAWLEDRVAGGAWIDLKSTSGYTFISKPGDRIDRFVIHINVALNSQTVAPKPLPAKLFNNDYLIATSTVAQLSTGPVGSTTTDIKIAITADTVCVESDTKISINPSLVNVRYNVYNQPLDGDVKGSAIGTGSELAISSSTTKLNNTYYVDAQSTDGLITIIRRLPVSLSFIKPIAYPDIRVAICPNTEQTINLSKYIDTINFKSVKWEKAASLSELSGDRVLIKPSDWGTQIFKYTVTDICNVETPAKLYLTSNSQAYNVQDTIVICHEVAETIHLSQIFGLEAGGEIKPNNVTLSSVYFKVSDNNQIFTGATTFFGKAAYLKDGLLPAAPQKYGDDAKMVTFIYVPQNESCFDKEYKVTIVLTAQ